MDAAGDKSSSVMVQQLKLNSADDIYQLGAMDRIQYDFHNCAYFSLDSVVKSSQDPTFFELLKIRSKVDREGINQVEWSNMPPKFVKNATSSQFVDKYYDQHPESGKDLYKKGKTFKQFIESNKEIREVKPNTLRMTNVTIEKKIGKYTQITTNFLLSLNNNDFSKLTKTYPINQFVANHPINAGSSHE